MKHCQRMGNMYESSHRFEKEFVDEVITELDPQALEKKPDEPINLTRQQLFNVLAYALRIR